MEANKRIGVHVVDFEFAGGSDAIAPALTDIGRIADEGGVSNLSLMDHYFQMEYMGGPDRPMLEGYTALGFLAANTSKVQLQLLVTGVTYRHPGLLAKIVSTLDVLSGGRAALGLGAAWYQREHEGLGVPFPSVAERFERLEEALQIVRQMWSSDNGAFSGTHYQLAETLNNPQPLQRPHPPIMIGGSGERKTLRLVAQYGDACNLFAGRASLDAEAIQRKLAVLRRHCDEVGTDYDAIRKTILYVGSTHPASDDGREFCAELAKFAEVGITEAHLMPGHSDPRPFISDVAEHVIPRLQKG